MPYGSMNGASQLGAGWGPQGFTMPQMGRFDPMAGVPQMPQLSPALTDQPGGGAGGSWNWFDQTDANGIKTQGRLMPALGVAQGAFNAWMGMKQYGLAKDQLAEGRQQFNLNYDAQRTTTNSQLEDRQRARVASNGGAYQSVGDYMNLNGIKPR